METRDAEEPRAGSTGAPHWQGGGGEAASQLRQAGLAGRWACGWGPRGVRGRTRGRPLPAPHSVPKELSVCESLHVLRLTSVFPQKHLGVRGGFAVFSGFVPQRQEGRLPLGVSRVGGNEQSRGDQSRPHLSDRDGSEGDAVRHLSSRPCASAASALQSVYLHESHDSPAIKCERKVT